MESEYQYQGRDNKQAEKHIAIKVIEESNSTGMASAYQGG